MSESPTPQAPDWLKSLSSADVATGVDAGAPVIEVAAPEAPLADFDPNSPDWLQRNLVEVPPLDPFVPEAPSEVVAPAAEEKPAEKIATIPLQPSEADQSAIAQQLKDRGRGMMDRRAARAAERTNLAERQKSMLKIQEAKEAVGKLKEVLPAPLAPEQALKLARRAQKLQEYADKMSPTTAAMVEGRAARRRGGLTESAKAGKGLDIEDLQVEVNCKQAVIDELGIPGQAEAVNSLSSQHGLAQQELQAATSSVATASERERAAEENLRLKEAELKRKKLAPEDREAILDKKRVDLLTAKIGAAEATIAEQKAVAREAQLRTNLEQAQYNLNANRTTEAQIKGLISQRQDAINLASAEIAVAGKVSAKTQTELIDARENCQTLAQGSRREIDMDTISRNINQTNEFVDRLTEVRILPGGLRNQLRMIDTEINYLHQPAAVEGGLDPALEMAIERNVRSLGGGDTGREAYLRALLRDRSTVQSLIDIDNDPYSLIQNPSTPAILRQALSETQAEEVHRSANKVSGTEGEGAHGGFLEVNSEFQGVNLAAEGQRAALTKVLESFGLTPPLTASEQQHWQQVGGDLRGMEVSEDWKNIISRAEIRQRSVADLAAAETRLAEAQAEAARIQADLEARATTAEARVTSTEDTLRQTERQATEMAPLADEGRAVREAKAEKAEAVANAKTEMDQALEARALGAGDRTKESEAEKALATAAEKMSAAGVGDEAQENLLRVINEQAGEDLGAKGERSATETAKILVDAIKSNEDVKTVAAKLRKVGMGLMGKALEAGVNPAQERALLAGFLDVVNNYLSADKTKLSEATTRHSLGKVAEAANALSEAGFAGFGLIDPVVKLMLESMFSSK